MRPAAKWLNLQVIDPPQVLSIMVLSTGARLEADAAGNDR
jgi:hypothetical protein